MIYAIVMAGGRGTRLKVNVEKPLFKLHGKPLIKYVLDNISSSKLVEGCCYCRKSPYSGNNQIFKNH